MLEALKTSERTALRQLARAELPRLYALARRLGGVDAEDLVQETLLRACRSFGSLRDREAGPKWLTTILTNVWRDWLRKHEREPVELPLDADEPFSLYRTLEQEDPFPYSDTLHVDFLGAFSEHDVHVVLHRVPPRYRVALVLRYVEGYSTSEIAEMLERPAGTVMSQLHRGRNRFEREMWDYAEESGLVDGGSAGRPASAGSRHEPGEVGP